VPKRKQPLKSPIADPSLAALSQLGKRVHREAIETVVREAYARLRAAESSPDAAPEDLAAKLENFKTSTEGM